MRIEVSLYDRYKIYFSDLNVGAKVSLPAFSQTASNKKEEFQIYAYNGGLFKVDEELNTLKIDDALWDVLDKLDVIVTELGGKIYLTKDARMLNDSFEKQYPNQIQVANKFQSDQIIRLKNIILILRESLYKYKIMKLNK